jgi:hypothetical protein
MRVPVVLRILTLAALQSGCSFFCYGARNMVEEPIEAIDRCLLTNRAKQMADAAWADCTKQDPESAHRFYFEDGFKSGFVDCILSNGNGEPPAAPPWIYQTIGFETPTGQQAIVEWFAGFRQGAQAARATGYREAAVILPIALPPRYGRGGSGDYGPSPAAPAGEPPTDLPAPRKVPPAPLGPPDDGGPPSPGSRR